MSRISLHDLANLLVETPEGPMHIAVLLRFERAPFVRANGRLDIERMRAALAPRIALIPELNDRVESGRVWPRWVRHEPLELERHVREVEVDAPGLEAELMSAAAAVLATPLDRARPLWELCFLTGLDRGEVAAVFKVHHAVVDGAGLLRVAQMLLDPDPSLTARPWRPHWRTTRAKALLADMSALPSMFAAVSRRRAVELNAPVHSGRRLGVLRLDLAAVKDAVHARGVTVNDVILALVAAGVTAELERIRAPVAGRVVNALVAVSRPDPPAGSRRRNHSGAAIVPLPLSGSSIEERLLAIRHATAATRHYRGFAVVEGLAVAAAVTRLALVVNRRQRVVQLAISNLVGPATALELFGSRLVDAIPAPSIVGTVTIGFCALSYAGSLNVAVLADAERWPSLDHVVEAMSRSWRELAATSAAETAPPVHSPS